MATGKRARPAEGFYREMKGKCSSESREGTSKKNGKG